MKFIFNFIFFGLLFYLIWLFFPDAFKTMVSWADHVVAYIREIVSSLWERYGQTPPIKPPPAIPPETAWLIVPMFLQYFRSKL